MEKRFKKPPFVLDRSRSGELAAQLAAAMRQAIETGFYGGGEAIPPTRDLAAMLGVSRVVAIRAMRQLEEQRLVVRRPHYGCVVCPKDRPLWKGQVLIVVPPGIGNIRENSVYATLRDTLTAEGYMTFAVTVPRSASGRFDDFALLEAMLRQQADLTVCLHDAKEVTAFLERHGVRFVLFGRQASRSRGSIGFVHTRDDLALGSFVSHCRAAGVKSVLQLTAIENGPDAVPALRAAGIKAVNWCIRPPNGRRDVLGLVQRATDEFAGRLAKGRKWLPDLLFFRDDHLATGAFVALLDAGVRIPKDVRVATWANKGLGPAFPKPLTRMEMDNAAAGITLAECVLECLRTGEFPKGDVVVGPQFIKGGTL